ncbi:MAG TPA: adenylate/guanylate cyclase domain-containing protein [Candidatus Eisenbacteria bacterium]|nr:adenylate/guanylate cyclase domain-containing protein [Candidatus Eisenbacteria bacterium]
MTGGPEVSGRSSDPEIHTPRRLAQKILTSRAALEGERKQVTVLFADLKSSMELLAERDPEDARKLLDSVLARMMEAVHHYEGTVNQVMGDGIMALFGAPLAHEDHAVRACYAALRMQSRVRDYAEEARRVHGVNVQIRVGVNSGEVVVRAIGSDLRMDYTAIGQTTHLAARMEQLASPGSILLTASTLALVEGYVEVTSMGPVPIKGLADPVTVYEVTGVGAARTRLQATVRRGLTRFVGRDAEIELLRRAQERVATGRGQVVAVVGEAGVGKSRLVYEFTHSHRIQGWQVLETLSVSYGKATTFLPVIELLKGYFKIGDRDAPREIREKVTGKLLALDRALEPTIPGVLALLDLPVEDAAWPTMDPELRRQRTLDAVKQLLLREAREQPLLVVFEDLHWIDGQTQALLDGLVESLGSARLLLLVNYRPEYAHGWGTKTYYSQARLDALPTESTGALLDALLGKDAALAPLKQLLVKRGNPFFLEETVRALAETGALDGEPGRYRLAQPLQRIEVPATVQTVLAARIDRQAPEDKHLLQTASVIGKDVAYALLQAIAELPEDSLRQGLDRLRAAEFLYETGLYPELEYTFKHALTHEVTYGGLLQDRRRALHARIVGAIEMLHGERLTEQVERLAHHAVRGGLREQAVQYLREAARKASDRSLHDARGWFEQAIRTLAEIPESQATLEQAIDLRLDLRRVLGQLTEPRKGLECLREGEELAVRLGDETRRARLWMARTMTHLQLNELGDAFSAAERGLEIAVRLGDPSVWIPAASNLALLHNIQGDHARVVELTTDNLARLADAELHGNLGGSAPYSVYDRWFLSSSLVALGRFTEAAAVAAEGVSLAEAMGNPYTVGAAHWGASVIPAWLSDWVRARHHLERCITVLRAAGIGSLLPRALAQNARALAELDERSQAEKHLREAEELIRSQISRGHLDFQGATYSILGRACLTLDRLADARRFADQAVEMGSHRYGEQANALALRGAVATHPDSFDPEAGEVFYGRALALAEPRGMRPLIARCHLGLGRLFRRTGRVSRASAHLATATALYQELGMRSELRQAERETEELNGRA